jgi:hypothetical protein
MEMDYYLSKIYDLESDDFDTPLLKNVKTKYIAS